MTAVSLPCHRCSFITLVLLVWALRLASAHTLDINIEWDGGNLSFAKREECSNETLCTSDPDWFLVSEFACGAASGESNGDFNYGWKSFVNPLPDGAIITDVSVEVTGNFYCNNRSTAYMILLGPYFNTTDGNSVISTFLPYSGLQTAAPRIPCCPNCQANINTTDIEVVGVDYNYGLAATNWLGIVPQESDDDGDNPFGDDDDEDGRFPKDWTLCLGSAKLTIEYALSRTRKEERIGAIFIAAGAVAVVAAVLCLGALYCFIGCNKQKLDDRALGKLGSDGLLGLDEDDITHIRILSRIGRGTFGDVFKGHSRKFGILAVKVSLTSMDEEQQRAMNQEISVLSRLRHPNIVLYGGSLVRPDKTCIVMEYMSRGSLYYNIHSADVELPFSMCALIMLDAARGLNHLHKLSPPIMHRDLKSPNLLLDEHGRCKICDFGISAVFQQGQTVRAKTKCGSPSWIAPEVMRNEKYDLSADVYSFGIIMWELLTREVPHAGMDASQICLAVAKHGHRPVVPSLQQLRDFPPEWVTTLQACWQEDASLRPSMEQLVTKMQWFVSLSNPHGLNKQQHTNDECDGDNNVGEVYEDVEPLLRSYYVGSSSATSMDDIV